MREANDLTGKRFGLLEWRFDAYAKAKGDEAVLPSSKATILAWLRQPVKDGDVE